MKYCAETHPHHVLIDSIGNAIDNVLEYDDETQEAVICLGSSSSKHSILPMYDIRIVVMIPKLVPVRERPHNGYYQVLKVTVKVPGAKMVESK